MSTLLSQTALSSTSAPVLSEYLSDKELAAELNVSPRTLARWRRLREGPAITRIGRKIAYRRASINEWLASQEVDA